MIILPTMYRVDNFKRFVRAYKETGASLMVFVMLDIANASSYVDIEVPSSFRFIKVTSGTRIGQIFNRVFELYPKEDYYGVIADDVVPTTFRWDILLKEACGKNKIAWGFDGGYDEHLPRHPFIGGDLIRSIGYIAPPGVKHWYVDNAWRDIAQVLECGVYLPEIQMKHMHHTNGLARKDRTYEDQPDQRADEIAYNKWREKEYPELVKKLLRLN